MFFFFDNKDENADILLTLEKLIENWENEDDLMRECEFDEGGNPYKGVIRFYKNDDLQAFQKAIKDYMSCMDTIVREIYGFLHRKCRIRNKDMLLGSLCFEVNAK